MTAPARVLLLALLAVLLCRRALLTAEPAAAPAPAAAGTIAAAKPVAPPGRLEYREVFTPVDQIEALSSGFMPLERKRFESLVSLLENAGAGPSGKTLARVARAEYQAKLTDNDVLEGEGEWAIEQSTTEPTLLQLETCGLALSNVRWEGGEKTSGMLGAGANGKPVALVQGAGKFRFHWTLGAQGEATSTARFVLAWPAAPWTRLVLDLPASATPEVEGGLAQGPATNEKGDAERRQWTILCGGRAQTVLQVPRRRETTTTTVRGERLRQQFNYLVEERGGRFTAELELDVPGAALRDLPLEVGPGLRLTAAWYGDASLTWDKATSPKGILPGSQMVRLNLPEGVAGPNRNVRVEGVFSLPAGELTALPRLVVHGVSWQQGNTSLQVLSPLALKQLQVTDARQTGAAPLSTAEGGTAFEFQEFQRTAKYDVEVAIPAPQLTLASSVLLEFNAAAETAHWEGDFTSLAGEERTLTGDLARAWVVEAVESQPADAVSHWSVENRPPGQQRLTVQLARAITPGEPLRLQIRAHRAAPRLGATLAADRLRLIEFQRVRTDDRLLLLRAELPWRVVAEGKGALPLVEAHQLSSAQSRRVDLRPESLVFRDAGSSVPALTLASERPRFTADTTCEVRVENRTLTETLRIRCSPGGSALPSLTVLLAPGGGGAWRWSLADDVSETISARRLDSGDARSLVGGELWELSWRRPRSQPFELIGERRQEFIKAQPIVLAAAPAANSETGSLLVFAAPETYVSVLTERLKPLLVEAPAVARLPLVAAFRYEPTEDPYFPTPPITLAPASASAGAAHGWAWSARHRIRVSPAGEVLNRSVFHLEGVTPGLEITLPDESTLREARLDGSRISLIAASSPNTWKLAVAPARRTAVLEVDFTHAAVSLPTYGSLRLPVATLNVPTYESWAEVSLPADYAAQSAGAAALPRWNLWPRGAEARPFQPFSLVDWRGLVEGDALLATARKQGRRSFDVLELVWREQRGQAGTLTWGDYLAECETRLAKLRDDSGAAPRLMVDQSALRTQGFTPATVMDGRDEPNLGRVLAAANLVLLMQGDALVVTSAVQAAAWQGQWQWIDAEPYAAVLPGELSDLLASAGTSPTRLATIAAWGTGAREAHTALISSSPIEPFGNRALPGVVQRPLVGTEVNLVVFRPLVWQAWGWAACVMVAGLAMLSTRRSWLSVALLGAFVVCLALFLPGPLAPLGQGSILGVALGYVLTLVRVPRRLAQIISPEASTVEALPIALSRTATLWLLAVAAGALAATLSAGENGGAKTAFQVLVPVDENQKPVGEYWYLQKPFYEALLSRVSTLQTGDDPWLLRSAQYQAEVSERGVKEVVLQYALDTLHAAATVRLPLRRGEMELIPDRALLDGRPVPLEWSADERSLAFTVADSGAHRLELAVKPTREKMDVDRGFGFTVPSVPESRLELVCSGVRAAEVKVLSAVGAVTVSPDDRRVTADLGPATRVSVRWPSTPGDVAPLADATKDVFYWLHIRPGSVVLHERVKLTVQRGEARQLRLSANPQLRLLPLPADHALAEAVSDAAAPGTYLLKFKQPVTTELTFDLSFLAGDLSGVGRLDVPLPKLEGVRVNRRWLAVSPDATLECEPTGKPAAETISPAQFVAAWGTADEPPALVTRLAADDRTWPIAVRVREPRVKTTERNDVVYDAGQTLIRYEAQVEVLASSLFQFRLQLPPGLEVTRVGLLEGKTPKAVRYSVSGNLLTVFLESPASKLQTLSLEGRLSAPGGEGQPVPLVRWLDYKPAASLVRVLRTSTVLVDVVAEPMTKTAAAEVALLEPPRDERAVGAWEVPPLAQTGTAGPVPLRATITPNVVLCTGRIITELNRQRDDWIALADLKLTVTQGELDVVALDLPAAWADGLALVLEPAPPFVVQDLPDKSRKRLLIWPPKPLVQGESHFQLRLRCLPGAGERLAAPRLSLPAARELEEYLVLPLRSDRQRIAWETSGMRVSDPPPGLNVASANFDKTLVLRVLESEASASVARIEQALAQPVVRLADVQVMWETADRYVGIATYDLDPAQLTHVQLRMPEGTEFVRAESCSVVLAAEDLGDSLVQCSLPVAQLPQRLEVVYTGAIERPLARVIEFKSPELVEVPVEHTLWTVWPPVSLASDRLSAAGEAHVFRQELYRLRSAAALVEAGRGLASDRPAGEISSWYAAWARHVGSVERRVAQLERMPGGSDPFDAAEAGRLSAAHDRSAAALGQVSSRERFGASRTVEAVNFTAAKAPAWEGALTTLVEGAAPELAVQVNRPTVSQWPRWLAAAAVVLGLALLFALRLQGPVGEWLVRWPHAACLVAGILAWMWLSPSLVGLVVVLASAAAALVSLVRTWFAKAAA